MQQKPKSNKDYDEDDKEFLRKKKVKMFWWGEEAILNMNLRPFLRLGLVPTI